MLIFFDVETTGLPKSYNAPASDLDNWPNIVQIAWVRADEQVNTLCQRCYVIKPEGFTIPAAATAIHGISQAQAQRDGFDLADVLDEFFEDIQTQDTLVAHNTEFDVPVLQSEYLRRFQRWPVKAKTFCTMKTTADLCRLPKRNGKPGFKYPNLGELHTFLMGESFQGAHSALVDVLALKRCYRALQEKAPHLTVS